MTRAANTNITITLDHSELTGVVANEHLDWTANVGTIHTDNYIENVSTSLSLGTITATTFGITSDGGTDDVVLPEANTTQAGLLGSDKWDEIVANSLKTSNISTSLSVGTINSTTVAITSDGGTDDVTLPAFASASTNAGLVTGSNSLGNTYFLRADNSWAIPSGLGDVFKVGIPVDNQIGVWTGDGTIEGTTGLTYTSNILQIANSEPSLIFEDTDLGAVKGQEFKIAQVGQTLVFSNADSEGSWENRIVWDPTQDNSHFYFETTQIRLRNDINSASLTADGCVYYNLDNDNIMYQANGARRYLLDDLYAGSSSITTVGTIGTGTWQADDIVDTYISSASTWNGKQDALTFGIANTNAVLINDASAQVNDYTKLTASGLLGRSYAEVKTDLSLNNVDNVSINSWAGSSNIITVGALSSGSITTGFSAIGDSFISSASTWDSKQAGDASLTSISGLTYVSGSFISLTAEDTYSVRTYAETLSDIGAEGADSTIIKETDVDDTPVDAADVAPISSNWAYDHAVGETVNLHTTLGTVISGTISTGAVVADVTMTLGSDADGDTYYRSSNKLTRLAKGTAYQKLTINSGATAPNWITDNETIGIACSDVTTDLTTGQKAVFDIPYNFIVTRVYGSVATAPTGSTLTVDIEDEGTTILNAVLSFTVSTTNAETSTFTGSASSYTFTKDDLVSIDIDQIGSTVAGAGLIIFLEGYRT